MALGVIVAALDGSEPSRRAADLPVVLAEKPGARHVLLNVVEPIWVPLGDLGQGTLAYQDALARDSRQLLEREAQRLTREGITLETSSVIGSPPIAICDVVRAEKADLVVLGSRGASAVRRALLGSVADRVLHGCDCPVLIVH